MLKFLRFLPLLFAFFPSVLSAQFPTAIGTKWEYFQFYEDVFAASAVIPSFQDSVVGDTMAGGNHYHVVRRTGHLYHGYGVNFSEYDTLDGSYYYRVQGTQVLVLDSVSMGMAYESLLYEFGLSPGDTLAGRTKNLINLTSLGNINMAVYPVWYNYDSVCPGMGLCDSNWVQDPVAASPPWFDAAQTWNSFRSIHFRPGVGTVYSQPFVFVLGAYGQHYFLKQLVVDGLVVYENPGIAAGLADKPSLEQMEIYPNPANDRVQVRSKEATKEIRLVDAMGKTVLVLQVADGALQQTIDVSGLPRGLYWVVAQFESGIATRAVLLR